jgi:endonuclease V-like protein UPF0215 family
MRKLPKLGKMRQAIFRLPEPEKRLALLQRAGKIYAYPPFYFQVCELSPELTARVLQRLTDRGHVPEALRIVHLIGCALEKGESGRQA